MKKLTKNQKWYYKKIINLGKSKEVLSMSYDELFLTLDRVKFVYLLDFLNITPKDFNELDSESIFSHLSNKEFDKEMRMIKNKVIKNNEN